MEHQEAQQSTMSADESNEVKNELKNLIHLMALWGDSKTRSLHQPPRIQGPIRLSLLKSPMIQNQHMLTPSIQINMPQPVPQFDHHEIPQYEEVLAISSL